MTDDDRPILQIVWHSKTGASRQLARAAAAAARDEARIDIGAEAAEAIDAARQTPEGETRSGQPGGGNHQFDALHTSAPCKDSAGSAPRAAEATGSPSWASNRCEVATERPSLNDTMPDSGAASVVIRCDHARRVTTAAMLEADGYLFVAPENLASMAGVMKDFFDRQFYPLLDRIQGRPAAVIVAAGSDGQGAVRQIERILTGWRLRLAAESIIVRVQARTPEEILGPKRLSAADLAPAADLGRAFAAGLALGIF